MAITVKQNLVPSSKYSVKCPNKMTAKYITFHNTANDASAQSEIKYMVGNNNEVSYHYAVDDKEVVQGIPVDRNAWHCGDGSGANSGNRTSIGVEVCYSKSGGDKYKAAEKLAIKFIAQLLHERGWGVDRVKKHQEWSGKYCPHRVLAEGRWNAVKQAIADELAALKGGKKTEVKVEKVASTTTKAKYPAAKSGEGIVDYLKRIGVDSSMANRKKLAAQYGISGYSGTSTQNTQLLAKLSGSAKAAASAPKKAEAKPKASGSAIVPYPGKLIKRGSKGKDVGRIQRAVGVKADNDFGPATEAAVKAYQKRKGLSADGIVGPATWNVMF